MCFGEWKREVLITLLHFCISENINVSSPLHDLGQKMNTGCLNWWALGPLPNILPLIHLSVSLEKMPFIWYMMCKFNLHLHSVSVIYWAYIASCAKPHQLDYWWVCQFTGYPRRPCKLVSSVKLISLSDKIIQMRQRTCFSFCRMKNVYGWEKLTKAYFKKNYLKNSSLFSLCVL